MINLNQLHIKNFFSHLDSTINFEELSGLVLLEGKNSSGMYDSNGSGKSSVLEGIVYALTGSTLRNVGVNDVVNRISGKNTMSEISLTSNNMDLTISRYRKDEKHGDSIVLLEDGKDISSRLNKSTQDTINTKLGIPYNVLVNTILLGEGLSSRFTQLSDPDKKALIESTLSLSYDVNSLRDKVSSYVKKLRSDISTLDGSINSMRAMIESFNPSDSAEKDKVLLEELKLSRETIHKEMNGLKGDLEVYLTKLKILEDSKLQYESLYSSYTDYTNKYNDLNIKLKSIDTDNSVCHLCGQSLNSVESKNQVRKSYMNDITNLISLINDVSNSLSSLPEYSVIVAKLADLQVAKDAIDQKYKSLELELHSLTSKIISLESDVNHKEKLLNNIEIYNKKVSEDSNVRDKSSEDLIDYEYIYKLFSPTGLITYILEDAVSYINDRLEIYTNLLIDKSYRFELMKGKLGLVDSSGSSYQSLSNGEKRRLDISIQFALHDYVYNYCGLKINFCFIDEILDTLDTTGVDNIFEVLRLKMDYCNLNGVIVITHNPNLKDKFDKVITVTKREDGFSYIN